MRSWSELTYNEKQERLSSEYAGLVKVVHKKAVFNYFGVIGELGFVCKTLSERFDRRIYPKVIASRMNKGLSFKDAIESDGHKYSVCIDGSYYSGVDIALEKKLSLNTFYSRLRLGWTIEEALNIVPHKDGRGHITNRVYTVLNETGSLKELCDLFNADFSLARARLYNGWAIEDAILIPKGEGYIRRVRGTDDEVVFGGDRGCLRTLCKKYDVPVGKVYYRMRSKGLSKNQAFQAVLSEMGRVS